MELTSTTLPERPVPGLTILEMTGLRTLARLLAPALLVSGQERDEALIEASDRLNVVLSKPRDSLVVFPTRPRSHADIEASVGKIPPMLRRTWSFLALIRAVEHRVRDGQPSREAVVAAMSLLNGECGYAHMASAWAYLLEGLHSIGCGYLGIVTPMWASGLTQAPAISFSVLGTDCLLTEFTIDLIDGPNGPQILVSSGLTIQMTIHPTLTPA
jgi:hypothetical protein